MVVDSRHQELEGHIAPWTALSWPNFTGRLPGHARRELRKRRTGELAAGDLHHQLGCGADSKPVGVQAQMVVLVRAPRPRPVLSHPLFAMLVGRIHESGRFFRSHVLTRRRPRYQGLTGRVTE